MKQEIKERVEKIRNGEIPGGYQKTKVGIIPVDWDNKKLIQIADYVDYRGKTPQKTNNGVFLVTAKNIKKGFIDYETSKEFVSENKYMDIMSRGLPKLGDVLITTEAPVGNVAQIDKENIALAQRVIKYRGKEDEIDNTYMKFYFLGFKFQKEILIESTGGTVQGIKGSRLHKLKVSFPKIKEQEKIAEILSTWDEAIELKEKLIDEKKVFKSGLRKRLLSGGVRFKEFNGAWQEFKLNEVVKKIKGTVVQASSNGNMPIIDMNYIDCRIPKSYSDNGTIASKDDVLILWDGSGAGKTFTSFEGVVGSTIAILKCNSVNNIFLQQHMDMNLKRIQLIREGSGIPHVPKDLLNYYKISLPESQEQEKIVEFLNIVDKDILNIEKELSQLEEQKRGLMQLLLTGIVRVEVN